MDDKVEIYDIMGRLTQSHTIGGNHSIEINKDELASVSPVSFFVLLWAENGNTVSYVFMILMVGGRANISHQGGEGNQVIQELVGMLVRIHAHLDTTIFKVWGKSRRISQ